MLLHSHSGVALMSPLVSHSVTTTLALPLHQGPFAKYPSPEPTEMHSPKILALGSPMWCLLSSLRHETQCWFVATWHWVLLVLRLLGPAAWSAVLHVRGEAPLPQSMAGQEERLLLAARQHILHCLQYYAPAVRHAPHGRNVPEEMNRILLLKVLCQVH